MVGQLALDQFIEVRILNPKPIFSNHSSAEINKYGTTCAQHTGNVIEIYMREMCPTTLCWRMLLIFLLERVMLESRYTPPNNFCKYPEYWHSPDSEATEVEVSEFIGALVRLIQPELVVETGTYKGHSSKQIGLALHANGHGKLVSIEKDPLLWEMSKEYVPEYLPVELVLGNSIEYTPIEPIDFAFFDSWQEGRREEFVRFYQSGFLLAGATVAFHDTAPHHKVWDSIKYLEGEGLAKFLTFNTPRGLTIGKVL